MPNALINIALNKLALTTNSDGNDCKHIEFKMKKNNKIWRECVEDKIKEEEKSNKPCGEEPPELHQDIGE